MKKLSSKQKKWAAYGTMVLLIYLAWTLSFSKALEAWHTHKDLLDSQSKASTSKANNLQDNRKFLTYQRVLKGYEVKKPDRENRLWQSVSALAMAKGADIEFNPLEAEERDSLKLKDGLVLQTFSFKGNYFQLVALLDTLAKSRGIGKLADFTLSTQKATNADLGEQQKLSLQLSLAGLER